MNGSDQKIEIKRLLIYLALSFALAWAVFFAFILTGHQWDGSNPNLESFIGLGMLAPFLAHILTRLITKEGFAMTGKDSMMMGISFKNKKWIYFLFAMIVPWIYFEIGHALNFLFYPEIYDPEGYRQYEISKNMLIFIPIISILQGTIVSFAAFGEEGGWRGYMMPKLMNLMGTKKAVLIGGIIWGLWHAPLTCVGHNFGTDYPGFPYVGILIMCIFCTTLGVALTYVTVKSGSIWPAAIMHAVNNANPSILAMFTDVEKANEILANQILGFVILEIPTLILGIICFVLLCKEKLQ
ncbi:MAG: CPBP family intramembrane metalloprotease [Lachnospiraceae bacterium]|nr:CPBP family intramembrane metalloprotease [Lachnospiraceae bacterium]